MSLHAPQYDTAALPYKVAVLCYLWDERDRLLMLHRRKLPNVDMYSPVGGKLEISRGESPHECAVREVHEETGLRLGDDEMRLFGMVSERAYQGEMHWLIFLFECVRRVRPEEVTHVDFDEGRLEWVAEGDVEGLPIPPTDRHVLWRLLASHEQGDQRHRSRQRPPAPAGQQVARTRGRSRRRGLRCIRCGRVAGDRQRHALGESGRCRRLGAATQRVAAQLPALPAAGQVAVVLEATQQEAGFVGQQLAVHQGGKVLAVLMAHG